MALCVYAGRNLRREARFTASAGVILPGPADLERKRREPLNHHHQHHHYRPPPEKSEHRRRNGTATSRLLTNPITRENPSTPEICSLVASWNGRAVIRIPGILPRGPRIRVQRPPTGSFDGTATRGGGRSKGEGSEEESREEHSREERRKDLQRNVYTLEEEEEEEEKPESQHVIVIAIACPFDHCLTSNLVRGIELRLWMVSGNVLWCFGAVIIVIAIGPWRKIA
ncbi:hypothetical protein WN51_09357 [Melipona quadrifasciata]|uniref:Uncharacterized protein n=1 Tax=Melipona quadrifasciata TaxID=166423 RepID=A0A0N0BIH6_9HYME|nr:hypothetical protein WN51_09357 [Melipona quadrifasciata]